MSTELVNLLYTIGKVVLLLAILKALVMMWFLIIRSADLRKAFAAMQSGLDASRSGIILGAPKPPKFLGFINNITSLFRE